MAQEEEKRARTEWFKLGKDISQLHFVGKDTVAVHCGCHILFHNVDTGQELIYDADSTVRGDGIQCVAVSSRFAPLKVSQEGICILLPSITDNECSVPDMQYMTDVAENGLLSLSFSEMEYLFALTSYPKFELIVWTWRNGERIASADSGVKKLKQTIRCNLGSPVLVAQLANASTQFVLWELHVCFKRRLLKKYQFEMPGEELPCCFTWSPEGQLFISDSAACVYMIDMEKQKIDQCFTWMEKALAVLWHRGSLVLCGNHMKAYKRQSTGNWECVWQSKTKYPVVQLATLAGKDCIYGLDTEINEDGNKTVDSGEEEDEDECTEVLANYGCNFSDVCIIYPCGDHIATARTDGTVMIWNISSGVLKGSLDLSQEILMMVSHPLEPKVVFGSAEGTLEFINVFMPEKPLRMAQLYLTKTPVSLVDISHKGNFVVAASAQKGQLFVIKSDPVWKIQVLGFAYLNQEISQITSFEYKQNLVVLALMVTGKCCTAGNKILMYILQQDQYQLLHGATVQFSAPYSAIYCDPLVCGDVYLVPHRSHQLEKTDILLWALQSKSIKEEFEQAIKPLLLERKVTETETMAPSKVPTGHQLRRYWISVTEQHLLTYGADGIVLLRTYGILKPLAVKMVHHRSELGIKKAVCTSLNNYVISLGQDGSIVCTNTGVPTDDAKEKHLRQSLASLRGKYQHKRSTMAGIAGELSECRTWLEQQEELIAMQEAVQCAEEKTKLSQDFKNIQKKVVTMMDDNMKKHPEEQLPLSAFDLDVNGRKEKLDSAEKQRELKKKETLARIAAQDKLCAELKQRYWETMQIKSRHLKGLMGQADVENYTLEYNTEEAENKLASAMMYRRLEMQLQEQDYFEPWDATDRQSVPRKTITPFEKSRDLRATLMQLEILEEEEEKLEDKVISLSGSTSHNFIKHSSQLHYQLEISTQIQMNIETTMLKGVTYELRKYFNSLFDDLFSVKEREMASVADRNAKLRHVLFELKIMTEKLRGHRNLPELDLDIVIEDPSWTQEEVPENIMKVEDDEVGTTPYISPSEEEILEKHRAEEEARRLAELADDFRERALITMMDGVLERRWEDEIKKDIPPPKVMNEKSPADFTLEDLQEIKKWEEQVDGLMNEREKYRKILIADFGKVSKLLADGIYKFNNQLAELHLTKLKVESAIAHEELKMARARLRTQQRQEYNRKVEEIEENIARVEQENVEMLAEIQRLQSAANDCRGLYEQLTNRDKHLDSNFRKNFPDSSQIIVDQLYKLFKRRPKMHQKATMSVTMMNELSRCSVTADKPSFLPSECIDFLRALDALDSHTNCPPNIHEDLWGSLCRVRRQKVECELKTRACALELAEAEQTVNLFQKRLVAGKDHLHMVQQQLRDAQEEILLFTLNAEIQLVLKCGMIEIPLSGKMSDFDDAILISRAEIEKINDKIKAAGRQKLAMMHKAMKFNRKILFKEWEHKKMKMEIADLEEILYRIEKTKLTKHMQLYLHKKKIGITDDKIIEAIEREGLLLKEEFAKAIKELKEKQKDLEEKTAQKVKSNQQLDKKITALNINVHEQQMLRDLDMESKEMENARNRMVSIVKRSCLVAKIQEQHKEILTLRTQLELLRLRTYPTLKHRTLV